MLPKAEIRLDTIEKLLRELASQSLVTAFSSTAEVAARVAICSWDQKTPDWIGVHPHLTERPSMHAVVSHSVATQRGGHGQTR